MTDTDIPQTLDLFAQLEMPSEQPEALLLPPVPPSDAPTTSSPDDGLNLPLYAERCYLEYAMSVVKGRALPAVQDGQKPVQRRILYT
ncbi:MAG TPA: hypothetical protein PK283_07115, partial [Thiotrichales bacterium]|nr:hypothetical protein [Thiotrichales bacterium]